MYLLNCNTCIEKQFFDDLESAQEKFVVHAAESHEVEIINLDSKIEATGLEMNDIVAAKTSDTDSEE